MSNDNLVKKLPQSKKGQYSKRLSNSTKKGSHASFRTDTEFYRHLIESIEGYAVFTTDKQGNISSWNSGAEKLLKYSEKEIIGKNINVLFTHHDVKSNIPKEERITAAKFGSAVAEGWRVKKNGKRFWASGLVFPLHDDSGNIRGFSKIMRDLSDKKDLELEQQKITQVFKNAPAFICTIRGKDHVFELANNLYYQLVGHRKIIGKTVAEALPEVRDQGFISILDDVYKTGKPYLGNEVKVILQRKKRGKLEDRYVNFIYQPIFEVDDSISGIFVHGVDVTEQVIARKRAEKNEERFKTFTEAMPQMAFIADEKGDILYYNQRWYDYIGNIKGTEGRGWKDKPIHHPDDLEHTKKRWASSLRTGKLYEIEYRLRRYDGEYRWHLGRAVPIRDENNKIIYWLGTNTDIHDQKRAMEQRDQFIGIASHELKTPVTSIKAYTQVLESMFRKSGDMKAAEHLQKLDAQVNRLTNLIGDLLDVTKIHSGRLQFHEDFFDFNELVNATVEEVQRTTEKHTIIKNLTTTRTIFGDRERIGQVLVNLITNAIKYSPHSDKIIVSTKLDKKSVTLSVQDFGVGIPKEKQNKVFEQFFRVSGPHKNTFPGLGLGLYISSEIIKREGGKIWVESTEGVGSTFYISLPLQKKKRKLVINTFTEEEIKHE